MRTVNLRLTVLAAALAVPLVASSAFAATPEAAPAAVDVGVSTVDESVPGDASGAEVVSTTRLGYRTPRTTIHHPGAAYVKVHFNTLRLAAGDHVTVADPAGREVHTYRADPTAARAAGDSSYTIHRTRGFAAMSVEGDTAVVTVHRVGSARQSAAALDRQGFGVVVDRVWRGFTEAERAQAASIAAVCGRDARRDVVCYKDKHPTEYAKGMAVAKALMKGTGSCTAWRVGNTNRMMTNNHCTSTAATTRATEMQFAYDCATCGGNNPGVPTKVGAVELLKTNKALDYSLVTVDKFESIKSFGTLYLDPRTPSAGERIYIPGHGDGKPKRLSIYEESDGGETCSVYRNSGTRTAYNCDTSGGNSGSPVLAASNHKVIVLHNTGSCPNNNGGNMMAHIYPEIQSMIDNNGVA